MSTSLPLPSLPHWAPTMTIVFPLRRLMMCSPVNRCITDGFTYTTYVGNRMSTVFVQQARGQKVVEVLFIVKSSEQKKERPIDVHGSAVASTQRVLRAVSGRNALVALTSSPLWRAKASFQPS